MYVHAVVEHQVFFCIAVAEAQQSTAQYSAISLHKAAKASTCRLEYASKQPELARASTCRRAFIQHADWVLKTNPEIDSCPYYKNIQLLYTPAQLQRWCDAQRVFLQFRSQQDTTLDISGTYLHLAHFGGHARHILPPFSHSQPVIADEEMICLGNPPEVICFLFFCDVFFFLFPRFLFRCFVFPATRRLLYAFFFVSTKTRF